MDASRPATVLLVAAALNVSERWNVPVYVVLVLPRGLSEALDAAEAPPAVYAGRHSAARSG